MVKFTAIGTMSGTSMDGIDISLICSDGEYSLEVIDNNYLEYNSNFKSKLIKIRKEILKISDLEEKNKLVNDISRELTILHVEAINQLLKNNPKYESEIVGFHGHTLLHKPDDHFTFQLGNPDLMANLLKKKVIFNFRDNDLLNGGQGAPLASLYHSLILKNINKENSGVIINIGGIANGSYFEKSVIHSNDIGPGNCLLDQWIREQQVGFDFDKNGDISAKGKVNSLIQEDFINQYNYHYKKKSLDINDFNIAQFRGLKLEDGAATLVSITANLIASFVKNINERKNIIILTGGGRKNKTLINYLSQILKIKITSIEDFNFDGDFIESQAFAYLAIRSFQNNILSLPSTTGVKKPVTGGKLFLY
jgi:anhydro-N-acetylmuramic acid kinase